MSLHSLMEDRRSYRQEEKPTTKVFPICSNPLLRIGLETVLAGEGFDVCHEAIDDISTLPEIPEGQHALFIIDGEIRSDAIIDTINQIKTSFPDAKIVIVAETFEAAAVSAFWKAGAHGFCLSNSQSEILAGSLHLVMLGEVVLPAALVLSMTETKANHAVAVPADNPGGNIDLRLSGRRLSMRETQILAFLREGAPNKVIARKLNLSESTVKVHVKAILKKVGACNRTQAALWATHHVSAEIEA
ncbi:LuxR C-terminal-related transcriptional regulator [Microvirga arabica]|uniref:LuxR C-terminal-related transcriptional regulator n=1 Tax=Microvirga arabica TaxID=1128671 RepID=UPI0019393C19|nr:response regulator transcription factor [Microvirga arabica]MBM1169445.1 response regulator transcription factor [Microvirga arabica]